MKNKLLILLLILAFIKSITWMFITPIFQVPDESSHFSLVQIFSEARRRPNPRKGNITSLEVLKVSKIINFNWKITHPVWQNYQSNWRESIKKIPENNRSDFQNNKYQTSNKRPPLYYWLATPFYLIVSQKSFLIRFFSVRLFSIFINLATVYTVFLLAQLFFKEKLLSIATAFLVAFQPMLSFLTIGVHYDPLTILISTLFLYKALTYLKSKKKKYLSQAFLIALLGIFINPSLTSLILIFLFLPFKKKFRLIIPPIFLFLIIFILTPKFLSAVIRNSKYSFLDPFLYLINLNEYGDNIGFLFQSIFSGQIFDQFKNYLTANLNTHLAQVFPWYWGVFGWLEKTMPLIVYRVIKIVTLISFIGWIKLIISQFIKRTIIVTKLGRSGFLIIAIIINLTIVVFNDFRAFAVDGANFGIQGRYFLPMIAGHMILLVFGLTQLVPREYQSSLAKLLIASSVVLNFIGLFSLYQYFGWVWG